MAEGRMLKKQISDSKKLGRLTSDSARLLYTWLIPWLDIADRCTADPDLLKGRLFPKCKSWNAKKIERYLWDLKEENLIILYESNGERYLQFAKTLQKKYPDREKPSEIPPPPQGSHESSCGRMKDPIKLKEKEIKLKGKNVAHVITYLNEKTGKNFKTDSQGFINARLEEGYQIKDFEKVIDVKCQQWLRDEKMNQYLRPSTLFRKSHFDEYLNEMIVKKQYEIADYRHPYWQKKEKEAKDKSILGGKNV